MKGATENEATTKDTKNTRKFLNGKTKNNPLKFFVFFVYFVVASSSVAPTAKEKGPDFRPGPRLSFSDHRSSLNLNDCCTTCETFVLPIFAGLKRIPDSARFTASTNAELGEFRTFNDPP